MTSTVNKNTSDVKAGCCQIPFIRHGQDKPLDSDCTWNMMLNAGKSHVLTQSHHKNRQTDPPIHFSEQTLEKVKSLELFGLTSCQSLLKDCVSTYRSMYKSFLHLVNHMTRQREDFVCFSVTTWAKICN